MAATPFISVVIPLPDHRGMAVKAVKAWCEAQQYPADQYELIVVSDGTNPALEATVRSHLRPLDSLITKTQANLPELTNFGAQNASSELLLITESHCIPDPACLAHITDYFSHHPVDVACCSSDGINTNLLAQMEQKIFDLDFEKRSRLDAWNKITVRGFAIKRSVYLDAKGFESQYDHFAEPVFGAHLHALGYQMGYVPNAKVSHYNNPTLKYLLPSLIEYGECKVDYCLQGNPAYGEQYFKADFAPIYQKLKQMSQTPLPYAWVGASWHTLKRLGILKFHQAHLPLCQHNPDKFFSIYQKLWAAAIHYGQSKALMKHCAMVNRREHQA
jgi:Glycosyl transferase family 2